MHLIKSLLYPVVFGVGYMIFLLTKKTSQQAFFAFRFLFVQTNGGINDYFSKRISKSKPSKMIGSKGVLGDLNTEEVQNICAEIQENGFKVFDVKLPEKYISQIESFARNTKVSYLQNDKRRIIYSKDKVKFDSSNPISSRYQYYPNEILSNSELQDLTFDPSLRTIASSYLNAQPILDSVTMWWSVPFKDDQKDKAAQMYHFDMDRFKFIKFFFYINDVNSDNGPHCYIRNSHRGLPEQLLKDTRITDEEIAKHYKPEDILELTAPKGSIIAVDTRGLHKGKTLISGERLLFQIQFSNSLFGAPYKTFQSNVVDKTHQPTLVKHPYTYQLFL